MPYKEAVIPLVDELDASASAIQFVNTIVNTDGHLHAYNTDYLAARQLLAVHDVTDGICRGVLRRPFCWVRHC